MSSISLLGYTKFGTENPAEQDDQRLFSEVTSSTKCPQYYGALFLRLSQTVSVVTHSFYG